MSLPTRRERLRTATVSEIKDGARRLLVTGGPQAISLRAIARDMGMTAPAIYRYFPSLEALVRALAGDLYDELRRVVEAASAAAGDDPLDQLAAMSRAFRHWSVAHPVEFALIFGTPVPSMAAFLAEEIDENHPGARFGAAFLRPVLELWRRAPFRTPPRELLERRLAGQLEPLRRTLGELPVEVAYTVLSGWTRLYGLVSMEVSNHLCWAVTEPAALFEIELTGFLQQFAPAGEPGPTSGGPEAD
ncbi:TetR/AcrR family transcriptional regulator [Micromonospora sp. NPDC049559]|uniref:TetR/AcrR family transcriptional regulator n=1 Tax=Micromonospora sp. NPDC049559 TaxID=3155923 RepID=UPI003439D96D